MDRKNYSLNGLEILVTIVNRKKAAYYIDLIQDFEVNMQFSILAEGVANSLILAKLDIANSERVAIFSIIREDKVKEALNTLEDKFATIKNGKGIAFTISMSSVMGVSVFGFLSNTKMTVKEDQQNG